MLTNESIVAGEQAHLDEIGASAYESSIENIWEDDGGENENLTQKLEESVDSGDFRLKSAADGIDSKTIAAGTTEVQPAARLRPQREVSTGFSPAAPPFDPIARERPLCLGQDYLFWLEVAPPVA